VAGLFDMKRLAFFVLILGLGACTGCGGPLPQMAPPEPPVVTVEKPVLRELDSLAEFTGRLAAKEVQEVRAQVSGYLKVIHFRDGDIITKQGHVLYEIDSQPYDSALANATAQVNKAISDVSTSEKQLALAKSEWENGKNIAGLSKEERDRRKNSFETAETTVTSAKAMVDSLKAAEKKAKFDVDNCKIRSEVKPPARVSRTEITIGNLVQAGQTVMCKVTSLDPMYVYLDVDEDTSLMYRRRIFDEKTLANPREKQLDCWVGMRDETRGPDGKWKHPGKIDYVAPEIIRGLGTREVRGVIANPGPDNRLTPGDSVRVQITSGATEKLLTVPEIAVGSQQQQKFVYVIVEKDGKQIAEFRPVVLGPVRDIDGLRLQVITKGLTENDRIVVNGLLRVRPGAEVKPTESSLGKKKS
jgi:RND family efflux transporter MFP subunit